VSLRPVALSIRNADMQGNRIFDLPPDGPVDQAPYTPWRTVREHAHAAGMDLITADEVFARGIDPAEVTLISYDWPPSTGALVSRGARLGLLTSLEPPVIAWELYYHLPRLSKLFPHVYLFQGGAARVASTARFSPLYFPQVRRARSSDWPDWHRRRLLVSINSNKAIVRSFTRWFDRPREVSIKRELASLRYPPVGADLYLERLRAVARFAGRPDFDVFGQGWQRRHPAVPARLHNAVLQAYRGPVREKLETLAQYQFSLCFENSQFSGYVSEKIFDCFFTGTIPIYLGAPDITRYIPESAFIDMRQFRDYRELELFLDSLDEQQTRAYIEAASDFLHSDAYTPFTTERFAEHLVSMLRQPY
jgi:alpha(1,3/1,4) fucosyltransferase